MTTFKSSGVQNEKNVVIWNVSFAVKRSLHWVGVLASNTNGACISGDDIY